MGHHTTGSCAVREIVETLTASISNTRFLVNSSGGFLLRMEPGVESAALDKLLVAASLDDAPT